ncbi:hypothetical protein ACMHYJ_06300 [Castellaniella hirudinis]|uniref:hypothetical protein n=1 Tax=Castellaniella hirudinis TaxID=1144617 RepID=UPI0039C33BDF
MTKDRKPNAKADTIECAVRLDCLYGKHDDIIELPAPEAQAACEAGFVDTHPNAVAAIRDVAPAAEQAP